MKSTVCAATEGHDGVCGPCQVHDQGCLQKPWSMLPPGNMLRSVFIAAAGGLVDVHAAARNHMKVHDTCCWLLWVGKVLYSGIND